jgi:hypothetical protein
MRFLPQLPHTQSAVATNQPTNAFYIQSPRLQTQSPFPLSSAEVHAGDRLTTCSEEVGCGP